MSTVSDQESAQKRGVKRDHDDHARDSPSLSIADQCRMEAAYIRDAFTPPTVPCSTVSSPARISSVQNPSEVVKSLSVALSQVANQDEEDELEKNLIASGLAQVDEQRHAAEIMARFWSMLQCSSHLCNMDRFQEIQNFVRRASREQDGCGQ
jgi:hypothetical protein